MPFLQLIIFALLGITLHFISSLVGESEYSIRRGYRSISDMSNKTTLFSFIYGILSGPIFILILSVLFYLLGLSFLLKDIYWIIVFYFTFRFLLLTLILKRWNIINKFEFFSQLTISIFLSIALYRGYLEDNVANLARFPDDIVAQLWIITFVFIMGTINSIKNNWYDFDKNINTYVKKRYQALASEFADRIRSLNKGEKKILLSIMIYESFQRPKSFRFIENILHKCHITSSTGIMQVKDKNRIFTDTQSIEYIIEKLKILPLESKTLEYFVYTVYNQTDEYYDSVNHIYWQLDRLIK
jgi:hypothetical protein